MNNSIQPTNFKGAFRVNYKDAIKFAPDAQRNLESLIDKKDAQIYRYLDKEYEMLYVVKDSNDEKIADFILDNKILAFFYYPEINKVLKQKEMDLKNVMKFIKGRMTKKIRNRLEMMDYIRDTKRKLEIQEENSPFRIISNVLQNLGINEIPGKKMVRKDGVAIIFQRYGLGQLRMSPIGHDGLRCVQIKPDNIKSSDIRCIVDDNGNIVKRFKTYNSDRKAFRQLFDQKIKEFNSNK